MLLLLFVIVCRMTKLLLWFFVSDSSVFFNFVIQTRCPFNVRTPWQYCLICSLDLPIKRTSYHISSVITGMRGAKTGISPRRRSHPCKRIEDDVRYVVPAIEKLDLDPAFQP